MWLPVTSKEAGVVYLEIFLGQIWGFSLDPTPNPRKPANSKKGRAAWVGVEF